MKVLVPKDNVNDDEVIVLKINFDHRAHVNKGDHILDLETSKTAIEIEAPCDGYLSLIAREGDEIGVGEPLFEILDNANQLDSNTTNNTQDKPDNDDYIFSNEAKLKLDELGITEYSFEKKMVTIDDVLALANNKNLNPNKNHSNKSNSSPDTSNESVSHLPKIDYKKNRFNLRKRSEIRNLSSNGNLSTQSVIGIKINTLPRRSYEVPYLFRNSISDLVVYESSKLLNEFFELNSFYINEKEFGVFESINAGFSFDNSSNLKVLSIRNADKLSLKDTQNEILNLLDLYESNSPIEEELLSTSTFTISDLSNTKSSYMLPLVSNNQSSIIGITKDQYCYQVFVGFDHKITSGLYVSKFLEILKENIESHFYESELVNYLKCDKCEKTASEAKSLRNIGFIKTLSFDGKERIICENCFYEF